MNLLNQIQAEHRLGDDALLTGDQDEQSARSVARRDVQEVTEAVRQQFSEKILGLVEKLERPNAG